MSEILNVPVFLDTLRKNDKYREEFTAIAEEVKADIVSFQSNPNCGCRRKIHEFVNKNRETETVKGFLTKWKPEVPNLFVESTAEQQVTSTPNGNTTVGATAGAPPNMKPMMGHVVEIPSNPDEYKNLMDHARKDRWMYRGLSVMEKVNADGQKVWNVFFY